MKSSFWIGCLAAAVMTSAAAQTPPAPADPTAPASRPWLDESLPPDARADLALAVMTQDEKIRLVHGYGVASSASNGGAGFVPGIVRLGLPDLNMADSSVGVTRGAASGRYSTLLPSDLGATASWDPRIAFEYGALIGRELRDQGYDVSLAGGVDIVREPRNGRNFEYLSEDPVLAGETYVPWIQGLQSQKVIGAIKHFALNDQETGRNIGNVLIDEKSMRESDLLPFEIGIKKGHPGMVMCAYNKVNGDWSCENDYLLNRTLKGDWGFKGFVLSDWGGTHSTQKAALAGLDQEQPGATYFGEALKQAIAEGRVPQVRLDDMAHRILRAEFAAGISDKPKARHVPDVAEGLQTALRISEASSVLLKNDGVLPLQADRLKRIVLIGSHADVGVLTGGGSAQVDPPGGNAVPGDDEMINQGLAGTFARGPVWWPSSPLKAVRARAPAAKVSFDSGSDPIVAARAAALADVAIVFVNQPASEGRDLAGLALPDHQDALVAAVAAANPRTIVVLETGGAVTMPWLGQVAGVVEVWYPGASGAEATSRLLFGDVNFTAKLPITFPASEAQLPVPVIAGSTLAPVTTPAPPGAPAGTRARTGLPPFDVPYPEKAAVGYKWYQERRLTPLFPFGFGLSYTRYTYSGLSVSTQSVSFTVRNSGGQDGAEVAQVYAHVPGEPYARLVAWRKVVLKAGESQLVTAPIDPTYLSVWDTVHHAWSLQPGRYAVMVGGASDDTPLTGGFVMAR